MMQRYGVNLYVHQKRIERMTHVNSSTDECILGLKEGSEFIDAPGLRVLFITYLINDMDVNARKVWELNWYLLSSDFRQEKNIDNLDPGN